jgi:hypothetical protein
MAKYSHIKNISLNKDKNEYRVGITGSGETRSCDFYINEELVFQGIPFRKGNSVKVLKSGYFISVRDSQGTIKVIRNGKVVLSTRYSVENAFVRIDTDDIGREYVAEDEYLIVVTRNGKYGLYSSKRKMLLGLKYSTIDIDEYFTIVLGEKVDLDLYSDDLKEDMLKCMRKGEYMQIGEYSKRYGYIETKGARVDEDNNVYIVDKWNERYYWNDGFSDYEIDEDDYCGVNVPSNWDDYTHEDSLYDALGGEMDAVWNID